MGQGLVNLGGYPCQQQGRHRCTSKGQARQDGQNAVQVGGQPNEHDTFHAHIFRRGSRGSGQIRSGSTGLDGADQTTHTGLSSLMYSGPGAGGGMSFSFGGSSALPASQSYCRNCGGRQVTWRSFDTAGNPLQEQEFGSTGAGNRMHDWTWADTARGLQATHAFGTGGDRFTESWTWESALADGRAPRPLSWTGDTEQAGVQHRTTVTYDGGQHPASDRHGNRPGHSGIWRSSLAGGTCRFVDVRFVRPSAHANGG